MVDEANPRIPIPMPAVIPRPTSRGINWMSLFDRVCAARERYGASLVVRDNIHLGSEES